MIAKPTVAPAPTAAPAPPDATAFAEAHRRLIGDSSIQFDLPPVEVRPPSSSPQWDFGGGGNGFGNFIQGIWPVVEVLFWVVVGALLLFLLYSLYLKLSGAEWPWRRVRAAAGAETDWRPEEAAARSLLGEADALAAQGRFGEAAHLLLFRSIADIEQRKPDLVRPALTSRDIAGLDAIPDRPRGAFARIAALVERAFFARRALAEPDWRDARAAYEEFAFAEGWRG